MDAYTTLITLGCITSGITGLLSFLSARRKWRARRQLVEKLAHDDYFGQLVRTYSQTLKENREITDEELSALRKRIEEDLALLDRSDRIRVQTGLFQPSSVGRKRFVEKIAEDVRGSLSDSTAHSSNHSAVGC